MVEDSCGAAADGMLSKFRHRAILLGLGTEGYSRCILDLSQVWGPQLRGHGGLPFAARDFGQLLLVYFPCLTSRPLLPLLPPWLPGPLSDSLCRSVTFQKSLNFSTGKGL